MTTSVTTKSVQDGFDIG